MGKSINWKIRGLEKFGDGIRQNIVKAGIVPVRANYLSKKGKEEKMRTCKSCRKLEPIVGGDELAYYCNKKKEFVDFPNTEGRFCRFHSDRKEDLKNGHKTKM